MWAGAHVRPIPASSPQLVREAAWLKATAAEMERQMAEEPWCGITSVLGVEYLEAPPAAYSAQTSRSFAEESGLRGYRQLAPSEVPEGVALAYEYRTYCVNAPLYCSNLLRRFLMQGGRTMGMALQSEWEAYTLRPNVKLVINASGVGFGDPKCFPTRGMS
jgi:D-amino-acid oxidase